MGAWITTGVCGSNVEGLVAGVAAEVGAKRAQAANSNARGSARTRVVVQSDIIA